jgi:hypothetical protein
MTIVTNINSFPHETLNLIFHKLDKNTDLKKSSRVCIKWKIIVEPIMTYKKLVEDHLTDFLFPSTELTWQQKWDFNIKQVKIGWTKVINVAKYRPFAISPPLVDDHDPLAEPITIQKCGSQKIFLMCNKLNQGRLLHLSYKIVNIQFVNGILAEKESVKHAAWSGKEHVLLIKNYQNHQHEFYCLGVYTYDMKRINKTADIKLKEIPTCLASGNSFAVIGTNKGNLIGWKITDLKNALNGSLASISFSISKKIINWLEIYDDGKSFNFFALNPSEMIIGNSCSPEKFIKYSDSPLEGDFPVSGVSKIFWQNKVYGFSCDKKSLVVTQIKPWEKLLSLGESKILMQRKENETYINYLFDEEMKECADPFTTEKKICSASMCEDLLAVADETDKIQIFKLEGKVLKEIKNFLLKGVINKYKEQDHGHILQVSFDKSMILNVSTTKGVFLVCMPDSIGEWIKK